MGPADHDRKSDMGQIVSRLERLKYDKGKRDERHIPWDEIAGDAGIAYTTMLRWAKGQFDWYDKKALAKLDAYFEVQTGDILQYVPDSKGLS